MQVVALLKTSGLCNWGTIPQLDPWEVQISIGCCIIEDHLAAAHLRSLCSYNCAHLCLLRENPRYLKKPI